MKFFKQVALTCALCLSVNIHASVVKLADVLFDHNGLKSKLLSSGVSIEQVSRISSLVEISLNSLTGNKSDSLVSIVKNLAVSNTDIAKKNKLLSVLSSNKNSLDNEEFIDALNQLIYLADRYGVGRQTTLSCSVCVSDELANIGIHSSISLITDKNIARVLKTIPTDSKKITLLIKNRLKELGARDVSYLITESDERVFALFLELSRRGTAEYQDFVKTVLAFNKAQDGTINLAGPKSIGPLWRVLNSTLTDEKIVSLTNALKSTLKEKPENRSEAFFKVLKENALGDEDKISSINELKANNCLFN